MSVKFYCEVCEDFQPVEIEPIQRDDLNPMPWGDVVCAKCHFVIATMTADEPGTYDIARVQDKPAREIRGPVKVLPLEQLPIRTQAEIREFRNRRVIEKGKQ